MLKDGFSKEEVERAKSGILQQRAQDRTSDSTLAAALNRYLERQRSFTFAQAFDDKIAKLTPDQVNAAWRKAIDPAQLSVVIAGDQEKAKAGK